MPFSDDVLRLLPGCNQQLSLWTLSREFGCVSKPLTLEPVFMQTLWRKWAKSLHEPTVFLQRQFGSAHYGDWRTIGLTGRFVENAQRTPDTTQHRIAQKEFQFLNG